MTGESDLPTLGEWISNWVGFQLPSVPLPQTIRNLDKAIGKILLAVGENVETRIKGNTGKAKATGKIAIEGLYRTAEEKRKIENRAAAVKIAIDELNSGSQTADAQAEIDDDWLNLFVRLAEDKSSEELQGLFGRILAGEIRKPGSFSLRTIQFISTLSKEDANATSQFLSYALNKYFVPILDSFASPDLKMRIKMQELGLATTPVNNAGGLAWTAVAAPKSNAVLPGTKLAIVIENRSEHSIRLQIPGQILTTPARELIEIANPLPTNLEFLKAVAYHCFATIGEQQSSGCPELC